MKYNFFTIGKVRAGKKTLKTASTHKIKFLNTICKLSYLIKGLENVKRYFKFYINTDSY